jgi:hypothetical protein
VIVWERERASKNRLHREERVITWAFCKIWCRIWCSEVEVWARDSAVRFYPLFFRRLQVLKSIVWALDRGRSKSRYA